VFCIRDEYEKSFHSLIIFIRGAGFGIDGSEVGKRLEHVVMGHHEPKRREGLTRTEEGCVILLPSILSGND
jgi:hypothetical protein